MRIDFIALYFTAKLLPGFFLDGNFFSIISSGCAGVLLIPLDKNARRQAERRRAKDLNKQQKKNKGEL